MKLDNGADNDYLEFRGAIRSALAGDGILFIGAGAVKAARSNEGPLPLSQELADILSKSCGLSPTYGLDSIAQHFIELNNEVELIKVLKRYLTVTKVSKPLLELAAIPWIRVWTTNYDSAFEFALKEKNINFSTVTTLDDAKRVQGTEKLICHINGFLESLKDRLTEDFVLTSTSYATERFTKSPWSTILRQDLLRSHVLIFVGYSIADIDVARLIFNPDLCKAKIHFVDRSGMDPVLKTKLSKFGHVHDFGLNKLQEIIEKETERWIPTEMAEEYQCWEKIDANFESKAITDNDFYDLVLRGDIRDDLLVTQFREPKNSFYAVPRKWEEISLQVLGMQNTVVAIIGSFANGKTMVARSLAMQSAIAGREVYFLGAALENAGAELQRICAKHENFLLVVDDCFLNLNLVNLFCRFAKPGCSILVTGRSEIYENRREELSERVQGRSLRVFSLDVMDQTEVSSYSALISFRGLWGDRAGFGESRKISHLRDDCNGQLHAILLEVIKSPHIQKRLKEMVSGLFSIEKGREVLILLCYLQAIGIPARLELVQELLDLDYNTFDSLTENPLNRQVFSVKSGNVHFLSPVLALEILRGLANASFVTEVIAKCVLRTETSRCADGYFLRMSREFSRFPNLKRVLPENGKRGALNNFYETIKNIPAMQKDPQFWLQYAMARMSLGDLEVAHRYFLDAYSIAKRMDNYNIFQIDNHFSRLLLLEAAVNPHSDKSIVEVEEALKIIKKQATTKNEYYAFRSVVELENSVSEHLKKWTMEQNKSILVSTKYLLGIAQNLLDGENTSKDVRVAIPILQNTASKLENIINPPV